MSTRAGAPTARDVALEAVDLATTDPALAERMARELLTDPAASEPEIAAIAHRAMGVAAREEHRLGEAVRHLGLSVRIADRHHLDVEAARSRLQLGPTLAFRGDGARALEEIDLAEEALSGSDL